jgi:hypothetical protein
VTSQTRNSRSNASGNDPGTLNYKSDLQFYGGEEGGGDDDDGEGGWCDNGPTPPPL